MKKSFNDSLMLSWSYDKSGKGILLVGEKDPLGIKQRLRVIDALKDEEGFDILKRLGIELGE